MILRKSHTKLGLILSPFLLAASLAAQTTSSVQISTVPAGLQFYVDGQKFVSAATLLWPQGGKHAITTDAFQNGPQAGARYVFSSLTSNLGPIDDPTKITADPNFTWIQITFATSYAVDLNYFVPSGDVVLCPPD